MRKLGLFLLCCSVYLCSMAQDTIVVNTLNFSSTTRDTMISFPDTDDSYRKILMQYSMRCKGARVSSGSDRNLGCGEWDYSCNTYVEDNSRTDSLSATTADYFISGFSGTEYNYSNAPTNTHYRNLQKKVTLNMATDSSSGSVGAGNNAVTYMIPISNNPESGYAGKSQFIYSADELLAAGVSAGEIDAISLNAEKLAKASNLQINILATSKDSFQLSDLDLKGFKNVYRDDITFNFSKKLITFHTPFVWDGSSNLIFEFSSNSKTAALIEIKSHEIDSTVGIVAFGGHSLYFDGASNYVEANDFKGVLGTNDRTIEAWIKTDKVNGEICSWGNDASGEKWVFRVNGDGTLRTEVNGGGLNGTTNIADNQWHHVACVFSGTDVSGIKHYVDGVLETNGALTNRSINTTSGINVRVSRGVNNRYFRGDIDGLRIWDEALTANKIADVKNRLISPQEESIILNYKFDVINNEAVLCSAINPKPGTILGNSTYNSVRAQQIFKDFYISPYRPNIRFHQGNFDFTITEVSEFDLVPNNPNSVTRYTIKSNVSTTIDDERVIAETYNKWDSDKKEYFYDENNVLYDSASVTSDGTITLGQLNYMRRWPSRLEIMSFVTPYGIGLDLGTEGKTWTFDVTDFTPILRGDKRMFLSRGGQNQEEMDIKFLFIKGTPTREVLDIKQIWPTQQYQPNFSQILANDVYFPPVAFKTMDSAKSFKIKSAITGHGQQGEFTPRTHFITANNQNFERSVWKICGKNPVYPQGGTWIYDRAGWCPGMATDLAEYEITDIAGGEAISLDYGIANGDGDSRYIVNNQIVSYGEYNYGYDLEIVDIMEPSNKIAHALNNPMCINPKMEVRNNGVNTVNSITIEYWVNDESNKRSFIWPCYLATNAVEEIYFPIDNSIWSSAVSGNSKFYAKIVAIDGNAGADEDASNNTYVSDFDFPEVYPGNFFLFYRTNNAASENQIKIEDEWGTVVFQRDNHVNSTIYRDTLNLGLGCYKLTIDDSGNDGMSFWANSDGSGYFRLWEVGGSIFKTIQPDFGSQSILNFTVVHTLDVPKYEVDLGYQLYPNPTTGHITVNGGDMKGAVPTLYNAMGQEINAPTQVSESTLTYNLNEYPSGIYFLSIVKNEYTWTQKIIKN